MSSAQPGDDVPVAPAALHRSPNALAKDYSRFRVSERLLLTGHSHQAWPDVALKGQQQAWLDAAELVDEKWQRAEEQAARVRAGYRRLLHDPQGDIALGHNTHELVTRLLSALPLQRRPRLVTTDAEFHSLRRQLDRLEEEGIEIVRLPGRPAETAAERMAAAIDDRTACALISSVYYETAEIVPHLGVLAAGCDRFGAALLVDAYHHLNVVPFDLHALGLETAYVTSGGYKYCQLGEGNACLRLPPDCRLRPVLTGWFGEMQALERAPGPCRVRYGVGASRFAGATYDPTSHYRAAAVFGFHERKGLTPTLLRKVNAHQVALLQDEFDALGVNPAVAKIEPVPAGRRGGFLAIRSPYAGRLYEGLRAGGVLTDFRGERLRLGPAPYLTDDQLREAISRLGAVLARLARTIHEGGDRLRPSNR